MKIKRFLPLLLPIAVPVLLFAPYSFLNQLILVDLFGCGCKPFFNANHFSFVFWGAMGVLSVSASILLSKRIKPLWIKIAYILGNIAITVCIYNTFTTALMWN